MKRIISLTVIFSVVLLAMASIATAGVPNLMQYQGYLTDESGEPLDTTVSMTFTIYDDSTGGAVWWTETQPSVIVTGGLFTVLLGSVYPISDTVFVETERWLGITVAPDPEITPRTRLVTVPYAFRVATVDRASGGEIYGDVHLHSTLLVGSVDEGDPGWIEVTDGVDPVIIADGANRRVGIELIDPNANFHVETSDYLYSGSFTSFYPSAQATVVKAEHLGTGNYDAVAIYGSSTPADGYGYGGYFEGGYTGVRGQVYPTGSGDHFGVYGYVSGSLGTNFGVRGYADGPAGLSQGVNGVALGSGFNWGVYGGAWDSLGVLNHGVYGYAPVGETKYGVYGHAGSSLADYAGYFYGNVEVTGTITKGGGSFKIDHPLDPENKYLSHSSVESPDMKNVYDGVVVLEANGEAVVELPDYFDAVNKDFRYQLTCIGGFAPVYIAEEISGNQFTIAGGEPGMKISWLVTGIRKDPFTEANPIQVEIDKPDKERGKYLHPEAYGLGQEYGIHYEEHKRMEELREGVLERRSRDSQRMKRIERRK